MLQFALYLAPFYPDMTSIAGISGHREFLVLLMKYHANVTVVHVAIIIFKYCRAIPI